MSKSENRGPELAGIVIPFLTLSIAAVAVRCYVRRILTKSFRYDDWFMLATLFFYTINCTFVLLGVRYGTGQHITNLTEANFSKAMMYWWCCEVTYALSSTFTKFAAGTLLLRLTTNKTHVRVIWFIMGFVGVFGFAFLIIIFAQCTPLSYFWTRFGDPKAGHCVSSSVLQGFTYSHAAVSSIGDWTFGILPAFVVKDLNMPTRTKISVFVILAFANVGSIATLIRIKAINELGTSLDFLYVTTDLAIWSEVEVGIAIIAASIATYRPLFRNFYNLSANGTAKADSQAQRSTYIRHDGAGMLMGMTRGDKHVDLQLQEMMARERMRDSKAGLSPTSTTEIIMVERQRDYV